MSLKTIINANLCVFIFSASTNSKLDVFLIVYRCDWWLHIISFSIHVISVNKVNSHKKTIIHILYTVYKNIKIKYLQ